jgi:hypothetical protein
MTEPAITYGDLRVSMILGRGAVVEGAPEHTKFSIGVLTSMPLYTRYTHGNCIRIAEQVEYEITGCDPADAMLTLHLVHDWRPGQKDDPALTSDLDITDHLYVHRYRTDRGGWAWGWRCSGDGACDGHVGLDLGSRDQAEREARRHLAEEHATATAKED